MQGKYAGRHMTTYGYILPGAISIARHCWLEDKLTERARFKLDIIGWHNAHGRNVSLTARHFGYSRVSVHKWFKRYRAVGVLGLNEQSRRPTRLRQPTSSGAMLLAVLKLRKQYPAWSKYKLQTILAREGTNISVSTVGRILKRRGLINKKNSLRRKRAALRPKQRFPRGLIINTAGQLVQLDTKHIMLVGGRKYYQFTAIDVLTKQRVLRVYTSETSRNGALFLKECGTSFAFRIQAAQTDNGAPFLKEFDKLCQELGITHYFAYPRSPKQQSYVEASHAADQREFYLQGNISSVLEVMRQRVQQWQQTWNYVRPHAALNNLTPYQYYLKLQNQGRIATKDTIILQSGV